MAMSLGVTVTSQVTSFSKEVTVTSPSDEQMARAKNINDQRFVRKCTVTYHYLTECPTPFCREFRDEKSVEL